MSNTQQIENSPQSQFWPEAIRSEPRQDRFPWKTAIIGLLPGVFAIILLLIPTIWLRDQASRYVVSVDQNGQIQAIQANLENAQTIGQPPLQLDNATQEKVEGLLPVLAWPEWSPDGRKLAATVSVNNNAQVVVFNPISGTTTVISSPINGAHSVVAPGNGWSPEGTHLALLETDGAKAYLSLVDLTQEEPVFSPISVSFDAKGGLDWRPSGEELLVTTLPDGSSASTLHIVDVGTGHSRPFIPQDRQLLRANAVWSPDGQSVAYIVLEPPQVQGNGPYAGALWVARNDGTDARVLVADTLNMVPIWHAADPVYIYFSRPITNSNSSDYALYRVHVGGLSEPEMVGESYETFLDHPYDQEHFLHVAGDGRTLLLDPTPTPSTNRSGWTADTVIRTAIHQSIPTSGVPVWSPDGRFLATTNWQDGKFAPTIYDGRLQYVISFKSNYNTMAIPASGWAHDSSVVALVESDGDNTFLSLVSAPFGLENTTIYDFILDDRAGLNWHPLEPKLLVTAYTDDDPKPSLYVVTPGAAPQPLLPNDRYAVHADAAWSPDGSQIAYVATDVYTSGQDILPGALMVAASNGGQARPLLTDAQVIAPMWNSEGDAIYYIKVGGELGPFALYRLAADGATPPVYIGPGSEYLALFPLDRNRLMPWSADGRQLLFASEQPAPPTHYALNALNAEAISQIRKNIPIWGAPRWSPDGAQFAGTIFDEGGVRAAIYQSQTAPPILSPITTDWIVAPADGWSPDGNYMALLRHDGAAARLAILDTIQSGLSTATFPLDMRAGLSWRPGAPQVMVTSLVDSITPTLRIQNVTDHSIIDFVPADDQAVHADGVWSPDGRQVAYITQETITPTQEMTFLAGALWIADSNGQNTRHLVPDGLNFAPIWNKSQNRILFTRYITETDSFEMYQVSLDEDFNAEENEAESPVSYYGPGSSAFALFPFDRQSFLRWSPEGMRWLLPGTTALPQFIYYRLNEDNVVSTLPTNCRTASPYMVNWAPTNRGVLAACPSGKMFLHWTDSQRVDKEYPSGLYPSWQP